MLTAALKYSLESSSHAISFSLLSPYASARFLRAANSAAFFMSSQKSCFCFSLITDADGSISSCKPDSRISLDENECIVEIHKSESPSSISRLRSSSSNRASSFSIRLWIRSFISSAAASVYVSVRISCGKISGLSINRRKYLCESTHVFPVPAPASTVITFSPALTASRWPLGVSGGNKYFNLNQSSLFRA